MKSSQKIEDRFSAPLSPHKSVILAANRSLTYRPSPPRVKNFISKDSMPSSTFEPISDNRKEISQKLAVDINSLQHKLACDGVPLSSSKAVEWGLNSGLD